MTDPTRTTAPDLIEAIANVNARAKRIPRVIGTRELPTEYDRRHAELDQLITLILLERS